MPVLSMSTASYYHKIIYKLKRLRLREVNEFAQGHPAHKLEWWWPWVLLYPLQLKPGFPEHQLTMPVLCVKIISLSPHPVWHGKQYPPHFVVEETN